MKRGLLLAVILFCGCEQNNNQKLEEIQPENQMTSHFEHLQDLEWLVGNWLDDDENVSVSSSWMWYANNNFLIEIFNSQVQNQDLEGEHIVGWDPVQKKVRSWIFDSDGGFGEGIWSQKNEAWYVKVSYTLADGKKASAMHVYTKVDNNTYTFASENREIDGIALPNIGPFKVLRNILPSNLNK